LLLLSLAASVAGCGGGGQSLIAITPSGAQVLDSGQTLTITASVVNDSTNQGASFAVSGGGTVSAPTKVPQGDSNYVSVTYTAPTVTVQTAVTVTATALNTPSQTATVTITVNPSPAITTTMLPGGMVGTAYSATLAATGGSAPLKWSIPAASLPPGITLNSTTGALTGTPTAYGTFNFSATIADSATVPVTMSQAYSITILPMVPTVTTTSLPNAVAGVAYNQQLMSLGGNGSTPVWTLVSGTLPAQLTLSAGGVISGTPTNASAGATYNITVTVTIGTQTSAPAALSLTVPALPAVTTTSLPNGNIGAAYSQQLNYSGGASTTVTWAIVSGSLPPSSGLTLSPSGVISGTPATQTTYSFSVAVTVGTQTSAPQALTLVVNNIVVTSAANASGEVGLPFSFNLTGRGGSPPYTWSLATGSANLPAGLTLNAATGAITGSPTSAAGSPFSGITVKATDTIGGTATLAMTFAISGARGTVNNSELNGQYAFLLSGFDAKGNPLAVGGKFSVDGNGNLLGGVMDTNGTGLTAPVANASLSATTYAVGADNRGKLTLTTAGGTGTYTIALNNISSGVAGGGYITETDSSGQTLSGTLALQTPAAFNTSSIANGFAFGIDGFAANDTATQLVHRGDIGEIQFSGAGGIVSAEYLSTGSGSLTPIVPTSGSISIASNGRGTFSLTLPSGGGTVDFWAYVVNSGKLLLLSSDAAGNGASAKDLLYGQALQQTIVTGNFNAASLSGISVVRTEKLGVTNAGAYYPDAQVGLYTFNGTGKVSLASDENAGGTITSDALAGTYSVAVNGRVTAALSSGLGGCTDCLSLQTYFYLVGANQGFVLDFSTPVLSGYFQGQTSTGFTAASLSGTYAAGSLEPLARASAYASAALNSTGTGTVTGTEDENVNGTVTPDVAVSDTYTVGATGRVAVTPASGGASAIYIISPTKALQIDLSSSSPTVQELQH
jgi:hypothetical protein